MVLDWLVAMDQYFELEEIKDPERVPFTTTKLKKTKRQAFGGHMYDIRGSRRRSATKNKKFVSLRIPFLPLFHARIGCFLSFDWWGRMLQPPL